jgi:hypothetical protein
MPSSSSTTRANDFARCLREAPHCSRDRSCAPAPAPADSQHPHPHTWQSPTSQPTRRSDPAHYPQPPSPYEPKPAPYPHPPDPKTTTRQLRQHSDPPRRLRNAPSLTLTDIQMRRHPRLHPRTMRLDPLRLTQQLNQLTMPSLLTPTHHLRRLQQHPRTCRSPASIVRANSRSALILSSTTAFAATNAANCFPQSSAFIPNPRTVLSAQPDTYSLIGCTDKRRGFRGFPERKFEWAPRIGAGFYIGGRSAAHTPPPRLVVPLAWQAKPDRASAGSATGEDNTPAKPTNTTAGCAPGRSLVASGARRGGQPTGPHHPTNNPQDDRPLASLSLARRRPVDFDLPHHPKTTARSRPQSRVSLR